MNKSWIEISCEVPADLVDVLAEFMAGLSGNGVCVENRTVDAFAVSEIPDCSWTTVKAYLNEGMDPGEKMTELEAYLAELAGRLPGTSIPPPAMAAVGSEDWSSSWKANFKPLRIGSRLLIVPTWEETVPEPGDLVLRIDPGMAFGTGGHETTRLCLEMLERIMEACTPGSTPSLLDLGTGSGILAMAAALLGAGQVLAVDIDPEAVSVACENIAMNGLSGRIGCSVVPLESLREGFDIILANILAEELVRLAPDLAARLNPEGTLILSGILAEKEALVLEGFAPLPLHHCETSHAGEWVAIRYRSAGLS